jgi:hypothetical protein
MAATKVHIPAEAADQIDSYRLDDRVNLCIRSILLGVAEISNILALSIHPQRGNVRLREDFERTQRVLKDAHEYAQRAIATMDADTKPRIIN